MVVRKEDCILADSLVEVGMQLSYQLMSCPVSVNKTWFLNLLNKTSPSNIMCGVCLNSFGKLYNFTAKCQGLVKLYRNQVSCCVDWPPHSLIIFWYSGSRTLNIFNFIIQDYVPNKSLATSNEVIFSLKGSGKSNQLPQRPQNCSFLFLRNM
jgi:hypothetical protein